VTFIHIYAGLIALAAGAAALAVRKGGRLHRETGKIFAYASFFLGQAQVLPEPVRKPFLLAIPVVAVLGVMAYWWVRVSFAASAASFTGREREPG